MLLRRFALVSIVAMAIFSLALAAALQAVLHYYTVYLFRNQVADGLLASASHHLTPEVLGGPPDLLPEHMEVVALGSGAASTKLYDASGRPLWPRGPGTPGKGDGPGHRSLLVRALAGERVVEVRRPTAAGPPAGANLLLDIYLPLKRGGKTYAVLETETPARMLASVQHRLRNSVSVLVGTGFLLLWLVLLALVRSAFRTLDRQHAELARSHDLQSRRFQDMVSLIISAVDAKDSYTFGHSLRVAAVSRLIGQAMGLKGQDLLNLELGALLHEIGKIGVSDAVLRKPTRLNHAEMLEMRRHPAVGMALLDGEVREIIGYHHERPDGRGYPAGLAGDQIPLLARTVAVADCYEAMRSQRPYRQPLEPRDGLRELLLCAGTQLDRDVVAALLRVADEVEAAVYQVSPAQVLPDLGCQVEETPAPWA